MKALIGLFVSFFAVGALAQAPAPGQAPAGAPQMGPGMHDGPCAQDRETLCKGVEQGQGRIAKCLRDNKEKLSPSCKEHIEKMKEHFKEARQSCHDDVMKFCSEVKPGQGRIIECLKAHEGELSADCKGEMGKGKGKGRGRKK